MRKKKLLNIFLATAVALGTAGCGGDDEDEVVQVMDAQKEFGCNVINIYNAGEYIDEDVVPNFVSSSYQ